MQTNTTVIKTPKVFTATFMSRVSILAILGFLLMLFQVRLPFCPPFMEFDLGDLPAVVGTLVMGPVAGIWIQFIKNVIKVIVNGNSGGVGELVNFILGIIYIIPIGLMHKKFKNFKGFAIGALIGSILLVIMGCLINYFIMIPVYAKIYGVPLEEIINMVSSVNGLVVDLKSLVLYSIAPFNIVKAIILGVFGYFMYKLVVPFVK